MLVSGDEEQSATIGRAQGILMHRLCIGAGSALQYLRSVAVDSERSVAEVAGEIVRTVKNGDNAT